MPERDPVADSAELKEIREEYKYAQTEKQDIRDEGDQDMVYLAKGAWHAEENDADRRAREEAGRPMIDADELSQYVNQLVNDVRQNKRAIRVAPAGAKATPKTAEFRQNLIRQIEYRSDAPLHAYPIMFENAAQRSYGYLRIKPEYVNHRSFDQELRILPIPNPNMVTEDPNAQHPAGADWKFLYYAESWAIPEFKRHFGSKAKRVSFDAESVREAGDWVKGQRVIVAERWRIVAKPRKLLLVQMPATPMPPMSVRPMPPPMPEAVFEDELDLARLPSGAKIIRTRTVDYPTVKQQILNGLEILEENDFPGTSIPFVSCYGKILYVDEGAGYQKRILSLVRLARSPQMLYCYYRTQQAEMAGMIPKTPIGGYAGQFKGVEQDFQKLPHEPVAFVEYNFKANGWNDSWGPMPPPQRLAVSQADHLQALELCAEGARRAIQAAIGASPLPTQAQRRNEKSGVALKEMEDSAQRGSFHFIDHYDSSIVRTGQILDELIEHYYDAARDVTVRNSKDEPTQIRINDPDVRDSVSAVDGLHDVTISVGPWQASEREAASDFADSLLDSAIMKMMPPEKAEKLAAKAVRLKAVGPIGDEIADLLDPKQPEQGEPLTPEQSAELMAQNQQLQQQLQQAMQQLEQQAAKEQARAQGNLQVQELRNQGAVAVAEINAGAKFDTSTAQSDAKASEGSRGRVHESIENEKDRQHETALTAAKAGIAADAAADAHERSLETGDRSHLQALEAQEQAAALKPKSEGA